MRFIDTVLRVLGVLARAQDAGSGAGPGVPLDAAQEQAVADRAHRRRQDYRP